MQAASKRTPPGRGRLTLFKTLFKTPGEGEVGGVGGGGGGVDLCGVHQQKHGPHTVSDDAAPGTSTMPLWELFLDTISCEALVCSLVCIA
jgi:hypothetical protein